MPNLPLRVVFAGTPDFSANHLKALIESKHQLLAAYTQPDRAAGRGKNLRASPVKQLAESANIPVFQPASLKTEEALAAFQTLDADVLIVVAYGLILPQAILDVPRYGCLNVHASLLPRWRGAAPIQRAIEAGDETTGITIMQMDAGLDTGPMLAKTSCVIGQHSSASLHDELALMGPDLLLEVLADLSGFRGRAETQDDDLACYADKITKAEAAINWRLPASQLERTIRAFNPFPVCFAELDTMRIRIWEAVAEGADTQQLPGSIIRTDETGITVACGEGQLRITTLQLPGAKALSAQQVLNAKRDLFAPGTRLSSSQKQSTQ